MNSYKKKWNKTEKDTEKMEKENSTNESDFSENEIPDLHYLKPFVFEPETNIRDIKSYSSDDGQGVVWRKKVLNIK